MAWNEQDARDLTHGCGPRPAPLRVPSHGSWLNEWRTSRENYHAEVQAAAKTTSLTPCSPPASGATTSCQTKSVLDEYMRDCLFIMPARRLRSQHAILTLCRLMRI